MAIKTALNADYIIYIGGLSQSVEAERIDRVNISIPGAQLELIQALESAAKNPIIVIMMSGSSIDLSYLRDSNGIGAMLWTGYPGEYGGLALAEVVSGVVNPAGRLPITFYPADYVHQVSFFDMSMRPSATNPGRTYKFYTGQPAYAFGYGLSYSQFEYQWKDSHVTELKTSHVHVSNLKSKLTSFTVTVTNAGPYDGDNSILAFVSSQIPGAPIRQLIGFNRVHLPVGQSTQMSFFVQLTYLAHFDEAGQRWLHPGTYNITIGTPGIHVHSIIVQGKPVRL